MEPDSEFTGHLKSAERFAVACVVFVSRSVSRQSDVMKQ